MSKKIFSARATSSTMTFFSCSTPGEEILTATRASEKEEEVELIFEKTSFKQKTSPTSSKSGSSSSGLSLPRPLNLSTRKSRRLVGDGQSSAMNRKFEFETNFLYSDTNPVCVQLYLQAVKHSKGRPLVSLTAPGGGRKENKRLERLKARRQWAAEERCRDFWMRGKLYHLEERQLALKSRLQHLEDTKSALAAEVSHVLRLQGKKSCPNLVEEMLSAARSGRC